MMKISEFEVMAAIDDFEKAKIEWGRRWHPEWSMAWWWF